MPIEITGQSTPHAGNTGESTSLKLVRNDAQQAQKQDKPGTSLNETLSLTGTSALMQRLDAEISAQPVVDSQRVDALRSAIDAGSYTIDPMRVADSLIEHETALHGQGGN